MATRIKNDSDIQPGEFYEDCACHPCLCVSVFDGDVKGISLIDGSYPRQCSLDHCGVRKLTLDEVIQWKLSGPQDVPEGWSLPIEAVWWKPQAN